MARAVRVTKTLPLSKKELFPYFVTAHLVEKWAFPDGMSLKVPEMEAKPGGHYRYEHTLRKDGGKYVCEGHFEELSRDRIVQVDDRIITPDGKVAQEKLSGTVSFREMGDETEVIVEQSGFATDKDAEDCRTGWTQSFEHLAELIRREYEMEEAA